MFLHLSHILWQESKIFPRIFCNQNGTASDTFSGSSTTPLWNKEWTPYKRTVSRGSEWLRTLSKLQTTLCEAWDLSPDVWFQRLCSFHPHTCHSKTAPGTCYSWQRTKVAGRLQGTPPPTGSSAFICSHRAFQGRLQWTQNKSVPTLEKEVSQFLY